MAILTASECGADSRRFHAFFVSITECSPNIYMTHRMSQNKINENVDSLYTWHVNETQHQDSRISWGLAVHALLFGSLCSIWLCYDKVSSSKDLTMLLSLFIIIGIVLSISSIYSMRVGELANGTIFEKWNAYDHLRMKEKCKPIPHVVSLAPSTVMRSRLNFLMFYTFAPNVFCVSWLVLLLEYIDILKTDGRFLLVAGYFALFLVLLCIIGEVFKKFLLYQWSYFDRKEEMERSRDKQSKDGDSMLTNSSYCCSPDGIPQGNYVNVNNSNHVNVNNGNQVHVNSGNHITSNNNQIIVNNGFGCRRGNLLTNAVGFTTSHFGEMFIYHIMIDRFNGNWTQSPENDNAFLGGNINGITQKLDYIAGLGCNAIMLTPIYQSDGYHGYHITDYNHVDPHFGDWQDFRELVTEAHKRGMKVICDFVPNHCHVSNALFKQAFINKDCEYRKWFYFDEGHKGDFVSYQNYPDLPKFNLYHAATADFLICMASRLVKYGIDGLRIDHAIGVPFGFLMELRERLKLLNPDLFIFGEVWGSNLKDVMQIEFWSPSRKEEMLNDSKDVQENMQLDYVGVLDGVLDFRFRDLVLEEIKAGKRILGNTNLRKKVEDHFALYPPDFMLLLFLDNHDTDRFMHFCNGDRTLLDEALAFMRSLPYPSIVYYGTEKYWSNDPSITNGDDNADLRVRPPFDWN